MTGVQTCALPILFASVSGHEHPVSRINAAHSCAAAGRTASADLCQCLPPSVLLSVNARVMLRSNTWVEQGLVNGAIGVVYAILYEEGTRPPNLPFAVLVQFQLYRECPWCCSYLSPDCAFQFWAS